MGLIDSLKKYRDRMTGKAEQGARARTMAEAADLFDLLMDEIGWDNVQGASLGDPAPRSSRNVARNTKRNLQKFMEDGYIQGGIRLHTDFVFGRGIDVPKCDSDEIQEVVNDLWWSPRNQRNLFSFRAQQKRHKETLLSGELNLLIKIDPKTSAIQIYPIDPQDIEEVITDPEEPSRQAYFLVKHGARKWDFASNQWAIPEEAKKVLHRSMRYKLLEASQEEIDRGLVYHVGLNEFFGANRGASFIQAIYDAADEAQAMADDGAALSHANAEVGWKNKILKGGKNVMDKILAFWRTKTDGSNPARAAASDYAENDALSRYWVTQRDTGAHYRKEDMRALKLYLFAGLGFGEHYMGDASTGNLATATAMELPVVKMIQGEQRMWESVFCDIIDFAIDVAVLTGRLAGKIKDADEADTETVEDGTYQLTFPPIVMKELDKYIAALISANNGSLITDRDAARLAMEAFEIQEIDAALDELSGEAEIEQAMKDVQAAQLAKAGQAPPVPEEDTGKQAPVPAAGGEKEAAESADPLVALFRSLDPAALVGALKNFRQGANGNGKKTYQDVLK